MVTWLLSHVSKSLVASILPIIQGDLPDLRQTSYFKLACLCDLISDMPRLVDATLLLLREESACQQTEPDSDIDDDDTQHDEELMDAISDLLPAFAKSMGSHFAPIFAKLYDPLMKFAVG